jgi:hypothetical protein
MLSRNILLAIVILAVGAVFIACGGGGGSGSSSGGKDNPVDLTGYRLDGRACFQQTEEDPVRWAFRCILKENGSEADVDDYTCKVTGPNPKGGTKVLQLVKRPPINIWYDDHSADDFDFGEFTLSAYQGKKKIDSATFVLREDELAMLPEMPEPSEEVTEVGWLIKTAKQDADLMFMSIQRKVKSNPEEWSYTCDDCVYEEPYDGNETYSLADGEYRFRVSAGKKNAKGNIVAITRTRWFDRIFGADSAPDDHEWLFSYDLNGVGSEATASWNPVPKATSYYVTISDQTTNIFQDWVTEAQVAFTPVSAGEHDIKVEAHDNIMLIEGGDGFFVEGGDEDVDPEPVDHEWAFQYDLNGVGALGTVSWNPADGAVQYHVMIIQNDTTVHDEWVDGNSVQFVPQFAGDSHIDVEAHNGVEVFATGADGFYVD